MAVEVISEELPIVVTVSGSGPPGLSTAPATLSTLGIVTLSTAPEDAGVPVVVTTSDPRMSNARTPLPHKVTHAIGGSDTLSPADIGAATEGALAIEKARAEAAEVTKASSSALTSEITARETADSAEKARAEAAEATKATITSLSSETTAREAGDKTEKERAETSENTKLAKTSNLSDLVSVSTARNNLGLGSAATESKAAFDAAGLAASETKIERERAETAEALKVNKSEIGSAGETAKVLRADDTFLLNRASIAEVNIITLNTNWSLGESQPIFVGKDVIGTHMNMKVGSEASPDTIFGPAAKVSRTISIPESSFSGAGSLGLAAIAGVTKALSTSQGQAVGVEGGAVTASTYEGEHSNADAFGGGFVGRSTAGSNRVGGGLYATGQRNNSLGRATGAEITAENNTATPGIYNPNTYSSVTGVWLAPKGTSDGGVGAVIGHPESVKFKVGFAANENSVTDSTFRDDSESLISIDIRKPHSTAAIKLAEGVGKVDFGKNEFVNPPTALGAPYRLLGVPMSGNANTSAASGNKYFLIPGQTNAKEVNPQSTAAANLPYRIPIIASDFIGIGTPKLHVRALLTTAATAPGVTIKVGLYKISGAPTQTLSTLIEGSEITIEGAAKEANTIYGGSDFALPEDGTYALGYTVSGTPTGGFALESLLQYHYV